MVIGAERIVGDVTVLDLSGKMSPEEGSNFLKERIARLVQEGRKKLVLNLEDVSHINSGGLGELARTYATVRRAGGDLKLLNPTERIRNLLALTKLRSVFEAFDTEAAAIQSFSTPSAR